MAKRSKFNLSHTNLLTGDMGLAYPVQVREVLPNQGDRCQTNILLRASPLMAPVMHPVKVRVHHFYVPSRLLTDTQEDWENFITGGKSGDDATVLPTVTVPTPATNAPLLDYMGIPPVPGLNVLALPIRAYNKIINEYFIDQDLSTERLVDDMTVAKICWEKDYLSSARPWPQRGNSVTVSIGGSAPVTGLGVSHTPANTFPVVSKQVIESDGSSPTYANSSGSSLDTWYLEESATAGQPNVFADLAQAEGMDVIEFRRALGLMRYKEFTARYGARYADYLASLGVFAQDQRLQRPEFLGGGSQMVSFSEVLQTAEGTDPVGELKGHGISALSSNAFQRYYPEHGYVISIMSVRPKAVYEQGVHRMWDRKTKEDFYQKYLELIGQQAILNKEVFADASASDDLVFGYADRYREYREHPSKVSGLFRTTLDHWHLARDFSVLPGLNQTFVECTPSKRIHADTTGHTIWLRVDNRVVSRSPVSKNPSARII